ncbi:hypothetical protein FOL47_010871 [Perkinsus chesapeaki]|uniref:SH3 domain-containing protein n=1 Tax=Perkinsus chesapeaki TaxID=330153 RepID=A0A7J6MNK5_PERCH|nr:hypothetical protein FOL47_010871 [Perkinsus chesapeaki]
MGCSFSKTSKDAVLKYTVDGASDHQADYEGATENDLFDSAGARPELSSADVDALETIGQSLGKIAFRAEEILLAMPSREVLSVGVEGYVWDFASNQTTKARIQAVEDDHLWISQYACAEPVRIRTYEFTPDWLPPSTASEPLKAFQCRHGFRAASTDSSQLSVSKGDLLIVLEQHVSGWTFARKSRRQKGWLPSNVVAPLLRTCIVNHAYRAYNAEQPDGTLVEIEVVVGDLVQLVERHPSGWTFVKITDFTLEVPLRRCWLPDSILVETELVHTVGRYSGENFDVDDGQVVEVLERHQSGWTFVKMREAYQEKDGSWTHSADWVPDAILKHDPMYEIERREQQQHKLSASLRAALLRIIHSCETEKRAIESALHGVSVNDEGPDGSTMATKVADLAATLDHICSAVGIGHRDTDSDRGDTNMALLKAALAEGTGEGEAEERFPQWCAVGEECRWYSSNQGKFFDVVIVGLKGDDVCFIFKHNTAYYKYATSSDIGVKLLPADDKTILSGPSPKTTGAASTSGSDSISSEGSSSSSSSAEESVEDVMAELAEDGAAPVELTGPKSPSFGDTIEAGIVPTSGETLRDEASAPTAGVEAAIETEVDRGEKDLSSSSSESEDVQGERERWMEDAQEDIEKATYAAEDEQGSPVTTGEIDEPHSTKEVLSEVGAERSGIPLPPPPVFLEEEVTIADVQNLFNRDFAKSRMNRLRAAADLLEAKLETSSSEESDDSCLADFPSDSDKSILEEIARPDFIQKYPELVEVERSMHASIVERKAEAETILSKLETSLHNRTQNCLMKLKHEKLSRLARKFGGVEKVPVDRITKLDAALEVKGRFEQSLEERALQRAKAVVTERTSQLQEMKDIELRLRILEEKVPLLRGIEDRKVQLRNEGAILNEARELSLRLAQLDASVRYSSAGFVYCDVLSAIDMSRLAMQRARKSPHDDQRQAEADCEALGKLLQHIHERIDDEMSNPKDINLEAEEGLQSEDELIQGMNKIERGQRIAFFKNQDNEKLLKLEADAAKLRHDLEHKRVDRLEKLRRDKRNAAIDAYQPLLTVAIAELNSLMLNVKAAHEDLQKSSVAETSEMEQKLEERKMRREREFENKRALFEYDLKLFKAQEKMYSYWEGGGYRKQPLKGILRSVVGYVDDINGLTVGISCRNALATLQYRARMLQARLEKEVGKHKPEEEVEKMKENEPENAAVKAKREKFERKLNAEREEAAASLKSWKLTLEEDLRRNLSAIFDDIRTQVLGPIEDKTLAVGKLISACDDFTLKSEEVLTRAAVWEQVTDELTVSAATLEARMQWKKHITPVLMQAREETQRLVELVRASAQSSTSVHAERCCDDLCRKAEATIEALNAEKEKLLAIAPEPTPSNEHHADVSSDKSPKRATTLDQHVKNVQSLERALAIKSKNMLRPPAPVYRPPSANKRPGVIPPSLKSPKGDRMLFDRNQSASSLEPPIAEPAEFTLVAEAELSGGEECHISPPKASPNAPHV